MLCQAPATAILQSADVSTTGVVASITTNTLVLRTATGQFILFIYDAHVVKPAVIPSGSTVRILSVPREDGVQLAHHIVITEAAPVRVAAAPGTPKTAPTAGSDDVVIPESIRNLERGINRQARRFHAGVQGGFGLIPRRSCLGSMPGLGQL